MEWRGRHTELLTEGIALIFILLFVYTGVNKIWDVHTFQAQMAQSEMLRPYTGFLAWAVPLMELALAGLLLAKGTRRWGLLGSFLLMLGFSFYVYLIMTYSPSLPCSCGGILQAMDWPTHLYFNMTATVLAGWAWWASQPKPLKLWMPLGGAAGMIALITVLFMTRPTPKIIRDEDFVRTYKEMDWETAGSQPLEYNSYYIAGFYDTTVYLGNSTGFTHGLQWDYHTGDTLHFNLQLPEAPEHFSALPKWQVKGNYFYIGEGVTPSLYRGKVNDWTAREFMPTVPYYNELVVLDSTSFIIRALQASTQKYVLALYQAVEPYVQLYDVLKQEPGNLFQADGAMAYDPGQERITYLYYYGNEVAGWDTAFQKETKFPLLYSMDHSGLKTSKGRGGTYLREEPVSPLHSNLRTLNGNHFIQSQVMGGEEDARDFLAHTVIDVYGAEKGYEFSFRLPHQNGEKIRDFYLQNENIIALYPTQVVVYRPKNLVMAINE